MGPGANITPAAWGGRPQRFRAGGQDQKWPTNGPGGNIPLRLGGSPTLESGVRNLKWPTNGPGGNITFAASGGPQRLRVSRPKNGPGGNITPAAWGGSNT